MHPLADPDHIKSNLDFLKENFGEFIPNSQLVVGKNERGKKTVYIIQDRIEGQNLDHLKYDEKVAEQLRLFLRRAIDTYINNLFYYGSDPIPHFLTPDLKGENFIFGQDKKNNQGNRLYFVDTYPIEGTDLQDFVMRYVPTVRDRFSRDWRKIIDEFREEADDRIRRYLQENKGKIKRIPFEN